MKLTSRQEQVLRLLCKGLENAHVAARIGISESTVEQHRKKLMVRTKSNNAVQLGVWATERGYHLNARPNRQQSTSRAGATPL